MNPVKEVGVAATDGWVWAVNNVLKLVNQNIAKKAKDFKNKFEFFILRGINCL